MRAPRPKKRLGQHFLHDRNIVRRILERFAATPQDTVVEIGPGLGALTTGLLDAATRLHAVEFDRDVIEPLQARCAGHGELVLHRADALEFDFCSITPQPLRVIGNLPYNISTPILFHLLAQVHCLRDLCFMLQKEVVDRLHAAPGGKDYGRLSVMVQWRCRVTPWFDVAPGAFTPPPQVDSTVVQLVPHATPPFAVDDAAVFARVVQMAFAQRRKTLRNALADFASPPLLQSVDIDPTRRGETLSLEEFARLANAVAQTK